jgi:hypothetical protein
MKSKLLTFILMILLGFMNYSFSQEYQKVSDIKKVIWLGVDFTAAKFTLVTEDPAVIVNQYLKAINVLIISEREKFNIRSLFKVDEVSNNIELVIAFNQQIDPSALVIYDDYKLDMDQVKDVIKKYDVEDKSGVGLIFVAENLNKVSQTGSYYVCFFDLSTKEIIDCKRMTGAVSGIGFRNYWACSIYNVMKTWALQ